MGTDRYVRAVVRWVEDEALEPKDEQWLRNRLQCFLGYQLVAEAPYDYRHRVKPQIVRRVQARERMDATVKAIDFFMRSRKMPVP